MTTSTIKLLPDPPAPNGINDFPLPPPAKVILKVPLPDQTIVIKEIQMVGFKIIWEKRLTNQQLEFKQQWVRVNSCTITPDTPFSQEDSVSIGVALSVGAREEFSASLGLKVASFIDIGAKLTLELSAEVTLAEVVTKKKTFNAKTQVPRASFMWWQLKSTYTVTGHRNVVIKIDGNEQIAENVDFSNPLVCDEDVSMSTQFPASVKADFTVSDI
ncbi:hypothetical protein [Mucilaginibacter sp. OK283]|jgi:hypothetical protein|uniref:hypothetical protein n=1 Tax=Mucilaginibacter sp. OK283 TaxID=1881049 RepID=UPI0008D0AD43|nr:hypothetical protein [Mucilaginibacter sp. OK283]SEO97578.1 hypothetical protein SAMN05428947_105304 [Mucilaginibacter sp. OK283]